MKSLVNNFVRAGRKWFGKLESIGIFAGPSSLNLFDLAIGTRVLAELWLQHTTVEDQENCLTIKQAVVTVAQGFVERRYRLNVCMKMTMRMRSVDAYE